jgi:hypothetical protein
MGGPVTLEAACRLGRRVTALIPVDTLLGVDRRNDPKATEIFLAAMQAGLAGASTKFMREWMFAPGSDPGLIERIVALVSAFPREIGVSALDHTWDYDSAGAMEGIRVPIHAVNSDKFPPI